jgi:hypothetical protein
MYYGAEGLRNSKIQHRDHKRHPLVPILSQFDPVHTITSYLSMIHFKDLGQFENI